MPDDKIDPGNTTTSDDDDADEVMPEEDPSD